MAHFKLRSLRFVSLFLLVELYPAKVYNWMKYFNFQGWQYNMCPHCRSISVDHLGTLTMNQTLPKSTQVGLADCPTHQTSAKDASG
jgi:hypothetical protein